MECADGVCKFVPRSQRGVQIGGNEENVEPALPPVSVGDKPPMPLIFETLEEGGGSFSLQRLCAAGEDGGRVVVLDLWSNACVRCPEALDKLNQMSSACQEDVKKHRVTFAAVNIDDKVKARALVAERQWNCLAHFYIDAGTKDTLKARFGLQSVPFVMVFDQDGILRQMGNPKKIDWEALPALWTEELPAQGGGEGEEVPVKAVQAFSLDEDF